MFKIDKNSNLFLKKLHLFLGKNKTFEDIKEFFQAIVFQVIIDYLAGEESSIPFLGKIFINVEKKENEVQVNVKFTPAERLLKIIKEANSIDVESEIEHFLKSNIAKELEEILDVTNMEDEKSFLM